MWPSPLVARFDQRVCSSPMAVRAGSEVEHDSTGLPIGVQVVGPHWRDDTVLAVMDALEQHFQQGDDYPTTPVTLL